MRVIVCGSRTWEGMWGEARINHTLDHVRALALVLLSPLVIVHGKCGLGADAAADRWARHRGYEPEVFPADWIQYRKAAGPIRNMAMAKAGADMCLAFLRDDSPGTRDMVTKARIQRIPTFVIPWKEANESGR